MKMNQKKRKKNANKIMICINCYFVSQIMASIYQVLSPIFLAQTAPLIQSFKSTFFFLFQNETGVKLKSNALY